MNDFTAFSWSKTSFTKNYKLNKAVNMRFICITHNHLTKKCYLCFHDVLVEKEEEVIKTDDENDEEEVYIIIIVSI